MKNDRTQRVQPPNHRHNHRPCDVMITPSPLSANVIYHHFTRACIDHSHIQSLSNPFDIRIAIILVFGVMILK